MHSDTILFTCKNRIVVLLEGKLYPWSPVISHNDHHANSAVYFIERTVCYRKKEKEKKYHLCP